MTKEDRQVIVVVVGGVLIWLWWRRRSLVTTQQLPGGAGGAGAGAVVYVTGGGGGCGCSGCPQANPIIQAPAGNYTQGGAVTAPAASSPAMATTIPGTPIFVAPIEPLPPAYQGPDSTQIVYAPYYGSPGGGVGLGPVIQDPQDPGDVGGTIWGGVFDPIYQRRPRFPGGIQ